MKRVILLGVVCSLSLAVLGQSKDEQKIREIDKAWSQAAGSKNLDKCVSVYADDASVLPFNAPIATGTQQIRGLWQHLMSMPGFGLSFAPTKIDISKGDDMAYEIGTFELKANDAQSKPTTTPGKYVVAWKKSAKGEWKVKADIFNTNK